MSAYNIMKIFPFCVVAFSTLPFVHEKADIN